MNNVADMQTIPGTDTKHVLDLDQSNGLCEKDILSNPSYRTIEPPSGVGNRRLKSSTGGRN